MHSQKRHQTQLSPQAQRPQRDIYDNHINQDYFRRSLTNFDLDDSRDSLHTLHKNASVMLPEASDRSSIIDGYPVSPKRVMDKKKMKDVDVKFAEKKEWKKENICSVCQRSVDTGGRSRHHCRLCASTVCGSCSNRKINSRRVCDTCFYKKKLEVQEKQMDEALARMDDTVKDTANVLKRTKQECENEREKCNKLENLIQQEFTMQEASKEKQSKVKYEFLGNLTKAKESQQNLTTNIEKNKTLIAEKESKLRSLKTKIAALNLEVSQKNQKHRDMKDMFEGLLQKHREITDAKNKDSVLGSILGEPGSPHNIVARNYSLLGNDKDGKYNISVQPVKI